MDATGCWLVEKKRQVRESTYAMDHQKVRKHINPWLGDIPIEEITESMLNDFIMQVKDNSYLCTSRPQCRLSFLSQLPRNFS